MSDSKFLVWNVRGLNSRASRVCVRDIVLLEAVSVVCLQETKVELFSLSMISDLLSRTLITWFSLRWGLLGGVGCLAQGLLARVGSSVGTFCISVHILPVDGDPVHAFWLTTVYGPTDLALKEAFLQELEGLAVMCAGAWVICGDFNLVYQVQDKSNNRMNRRLMLRFRRSIDTLRWLRSST
jgi:exonuclease III